MTTSPTPTSKILCGTKSKHPQRSRHGVRFNYAAALRDVIKHIKHECLAMDGNALRKHCEKALARPGVGEAMLERIRNAEAIIDKADQLAFRIEENEAYREDAFSLQDDVKAYRGEK